MKIRKPNLRYLDWVQIWLTLILVAVIVFGILGLHKLDEVSHRVIVVHVHDRTIVNNKTVNNDFPPPNVPVLPGNG